MFSILNYLGVPVFLQNLEQSFAAQKYKPGNEAAGESRRYARKQLGVYEVIYETGGWLRLPGAETLQALHEARISLPYVVRFLGEVWSLGPALVIVYILTTVWSSLRSTFDLYCASQLLHAMQARIGNQVDDDAFIKAIMVPVIYSLLRTAVLRLTESNSAKLKHRIKYHFMHREIVALMKLELPTIEDPTVAEKLLDVSGFDGSGIPWDAVETLAFKATYFLDIVSQVMFLLGVLRERSGGPGFILACVVQPIINLVVTPKLWSRSHAYYANNAHYLKMRALMTMASNNVFRRSFLSDGVHEYIEREFSDARKNLGDTNTEPVTTQWSNGRSFVLTALDDLAHELPLIYYAIKVLLNPSQFSVSTVAILQQTANSIRWSIYVILNDSASFLQIFTSIKGIYALEEVQNVIKDGSEPYPSLDILKPRYGVGFEFQNVSFAYPKTDKNALTNVSFTIKPGQMVVVVGVNGSGKSSMIKLLNRLYDPTEGQILLDGRPLQEYRLRDIRRAMAILVQDNHLYPVSLGQNVALGRPNDVVSKEMIVQATVDGGAHGFVEKLPKKLDTVLYSMGISGGTNADQHATLKSLLEEQRKIASLSGGETQRLVASRTFLRLKHPEVRLVVVDEPTSAMDPEAEYEIYHKLMDLKGEKTMIFITHRFGHLTKHADLILCMKDGELVESGTHVDLMNQGGSYAQMYEVQATAFITPENWTF